LVLTDIGNVGFKVENFDEKNMTVLEERWPEVRRALHLAVRLLAAFGYSGQNLRAASVLLPIAYYLRQLDPGDRYLTVAAFSVDRRSIQTWLAKSLLKSSGIWGSGLDTLLTHLRDTIREHGRERFPAGELERQMARRGKSLLFEEEEIQELLDLEYGKAQTFSLLTLLFPFVNLQDHFHADHIFPRSRFRTAALRKAGVPEARVPEYREMRDRIANLQLLAGAANIEKQDRLPAEWLREMHPESDRRATYCEQHLLGEVPEQMDEFQSFYDSRRERLRVQLVNLLKKSATQTSSEEGAKP